VTSPPRSFSTVCGSQDLQKQQNEREQQSKGEARHHNLSEDQVGTTRYNVFTHAAQVLRFLKITHDGLCLANNSKLVEQAQGAHRDNEDCGIGNGLGVGAIKITHQRRYGNDGKRNDGWQLG